MHRPELGRRALATWIPLLFCLCLFGYTCIFNNARVDDAYITASYARTLGMSGTWGMHPGFPSNAATSPLNVIVLAALVRLGMSALTAQTVLNGLLVAAIFATLVKLSRLFFASDLWAYAGTALLFVNPLLVSTLGLETYLYLWLLLACCLTYFLNRPAWTGLCCGLLFLARPDGILFVVVLVPFLIRQSRRSLLAFFAPLSAVLAAWELYAWRVLGSAVPDTFFIKRMQAAWDGALYFSGFGLYFRSRPVPMALSVAFLLALPLAIRLAIHNRMWRFFCSLVGGATLLHLLGYSVMKVPPYHWYYAQECATLVLLGSAGMLYGGKESSLSRPVALAVLAIVLIASIGTGLLSVHRRGATPISSNWGSVSQYRQIALWINDHSNVRSYALDGELGIIQYYSRAEAVNEFSDRNVWTLIRTRRSIVPFWLRRENNRFLHVPDRPPAAELTSKCVPGQLYAHTWIMHSAWGGDHLWCWSDNTQVQVQNLAH